MSVIDEDGTIDQDFTREINQILKDETKIEELKKMYKDIKDLEKTGRVDKESEGGARGLPGIDGYLMTIRVDSGRGERKGKGKSRKLRKKQTQRKRKSGGRTRRAVRRHRSARKAKDTKSSQRQTRRS